ncbi:hypothetical protein [Paraburkholderia sp. RAU2J]|uniref:hypothetical protein n=1 Tax=Paraburkholderia sp. RAU2J TaxID=1938810 RepID=UPI001F53EF87|nr:hypothetical protein [Paraburkholderia sp. RAU2J]
MEIARWMVCQPEAESGGDLDAALLRYSGGGRGYARRVVSRMQRFDASLRRE